MPKVVAFLSPKGGCGATFSCAGVWRALCDKSLKVICVDMCFEKGTLDYALGFQNDYVYTMSDVIEGICELDEAIVSKDYGSFLRCGYEKDGFCAKKVFDELKKSDFDYILLDLPSSDDKLTKDILKFADKLIYVTEPSLSSVKLCDVSARKYNFEESFVLVNKIIPSYIEKGVHLTIDEILDITAYPPIGLLPWSPKAEIAVRTGFRNKTDDKTLDEAFSNIAYRIMGESVRACDIKTVYDCFKLSRSFDLKDE